MRLSKKILDFWTLFYYLLAIGYNLILLLLLFNIFDKS